MGILNNRRGMYEYILVKSVMLIFIIGLVSIFMSIYNTQLNFTAQNIANSEATRISKEIDGVIGFKDMTTTATIYLKPYLEVGQSKEPYTLTIKDNGNIIINYEDFPYSDLIGNAKFGINVISVGTISEIDCTSLDLLDATSNIKVTKESEYKYDPNYYAPNDGALLHTRKITIDAFETCGETMNFEQTSVE